ncbi:PucR family transcriptional regulator [Phytoactinopolyspora mesophila]|uniref:PucR family transcriptional regulator n=1 Tax=Phytoactinopolyspora mesophila TaxID=2650750 RepID=A0A7K3M4N2_9ACTN|nr:PucR family transcriptional regulator ligand-binding domain-containing protein [Phytoactinopolyspora mesophila]NDL58273.1 PucR family transcriptional regulator [Phytoactinopolyspora mesophila]
MLPTVAEVLALPAMRRGAPQVVAGSNGLTKSVRWAHSAELSDIAHLLRGGELLMTTGIALPSDDTELAGYANGLASVGVSGLVVELGRRWRSALPPALVDACDHAGLPLITLSREAAFVTITQAVGELVVDSQLEELRTTERVHETFTELSVAGAGISEILAEVARLSGLPVILESIKHQVLGYDAAHEPARELLAEWAKRSRAVESTERTTYHQPEGWLVTIVGARGDNWGRLVLVSPEPPPRRHLVLLERAASTLALHRLLARDRESLERQTHRTLLAALSTSTPPDADVVDRCADAGVPLHARKLIGLAVLPHAGDAAPPATLTAQELVRDLAEATAGAARTSRVAALVAVTSDNVVGCLLSLSPTDDDRALVDSFAADIHRAAIELPRGLPVLVAAGTPVDGAGMAWRTLTEARQVASAAGRTSANRSCHRLHDVHLRGLLHVMIDDERLTAFTERELAALNTHDNKHGGTLLASLRTFVDHGGNKTAAAAASHLSRPAYYERLARIERILNVDLSDPETVTSLHVAILAQEILGRQL